MKENNNTHIISAGAGSGKTYTISHKVVDYICKNKGSVKEVIVTTFTNAAARELRERIAGDLLKAGKSDEAMLVDDAWIGTVHSLGKRLVDIFTFEAGYAPDQEVIPEQDEAFVFGQILATAITEDDFRILTSMAEKIGIPDWQEDIMEIVKKARENAIDLSLPKELAGDSFKAFMESVYQPLQNSGPQTPAEAEGLLRDCKSKMLSLSNARGYKQHTIIASKIDELLAEFQHDKEKTLVIYKELKAMVSKTQTTPDRQEIFDQVIPEIESCYAVFFLDNFETPLPELVKEYLGHLFNAVSNSYSKYVEYKKQRGLMDYSDQESEFLELLKNSEVREYLRNKFRLLLVDEFQDTNPMQLAIFMQLSGLAGEVFFVGDSKQSIYAFRGADPMLTSEVFERLDHDAPLKTSRRSRHSLVDFTNHVFTELFADKNAALEKWDEIPDFERQEPPVQVWNTGNSSNKEQRIRSIIQHLAKLVSGTPPYYRDKETGERRQIGYGEVAVLCKSNLDVATWAGEFEAAGIPVSAERPELIRQAEIVFMIAALSYIADPSNSLAVTELLLLGDKDFGGDMEEIIAQRMEFLNAHDAWEPWMQENNLISTMNEIAGLASRMGVREIIEQTMIRLDLYGLTAAWGKPAVRKANLQKLLKLADEYENRCITWSTAMSIHGFIQWIRLKDDLTQHSSGSPGAISVLTYHKAKGLEWPMVILDGLEETQKHIWWGTYLDTDYSSFDVQQPLKDRKLNFMVNPFGKSYNHLKGKETLAQAPDHLLPSILTTRLPLIRETLLNAEDIRKIYVGITRARDYLILPNPTGTGEDGLWNRTAGKVLPGFFDEAASFQVNGTEIRYVPLDPATEPEKDQSTTIEYFRPPSNEGTKYPEKHITPSKIENETVDAAGFEKQFVKKHRFDIQRLKGSHPEKYLGDAIHTIMASYQADTPPAARIVMISKIATAFDLEAFDAEGMDRMARELFSWIKSNYPSATIHREIPLRKTEAGQVYSGIADMVIEQDNGYILIDHKSYQGTDVIGHSVKYYHQLEAYEKMLNVPGGKQVKEKMIFYPVSGNIVELRKE